MRLGVLTHNYPRFPGDFSGHFVAALSEELVRQSHDVTILAPDDAAYVPPVSQRYDAVKLRRYRYAWPRRWQRLGYMRSMQADIALRRVNYFLAPSLFLAGFLAVARWVRQTHPDVLHAHWLLPNGFIAALASRLFHVPLVVSIPGSDALVAAANPLFRAMTRFTLRQAGLVTANSADLRDVAVRELGADPAKFDLILYGVDANAMRPESTDPQRSAILRGQLGLPPDAVILLAVGRMVYKKGFDVLLRAMPMLMEVCPPVHTVLVGDGDLRIEWESLARDLGIAERVHFVGTVPYAELGDYYRMSDVLVMPAVTRPETGLAGCVPDAMACGKPVVGSTAAGNPLAIQDGETGLLVPEGDANALADALLHLVSDTKQREDMGRRARRMVEAELSWPHIARRYIAHFQRLAGQPSGGGG